jgi:hypothetical protein
MLPYICVFLPLLFSLVTLNIDSVNLLQVSTQGVGMWFDGLPI